MKIVLLLPALAALTATLATPNTASSAEGTPANTQEHRARLLRHPTYSNGKIAFSYLGDIWLANEDGSEVRRLTDNIARDVYPRFSPDGKWIAFSSNRSGNHDVYVVSAAGGKRHVAVQVLCQDVAGLCGDH